MAKQASVRRNSSSNQTRKATIVERVVEVLHKDPNVNLKRRAKLPSRHNPRDTREVDVLATTSFLGRPIHLAFECKNYATPLGVEKIDEFCGKLDDIGVPLQHGIIVSINGFSRNAQNRANSLGIRLLVLEGLTDSRLQAEVYDAFQSIVYLILEVLSIKVTNEAAEGDATEFLFLRDQNGNFAGGLLDLIWSEWRDGNLGSTLGENAISLRIPPDWKWVIQGRVMPSTANAVVKVRGIVLTLKGQANRFVLRDPVSGTIDRGRIDSRFDPPAGTYPIVVVDSEEALQVELAETGVSRITIGRIPLPRIRYNVYWPPSDRVLLELKQRASDLRARGEWYPGVLADIPFADLEGTDLKVIWEPISVTHPASSDPSWPWGKTSRQNSKPLPPRRERSLAGDQATQG